MAKIKKIQEQGQTIYPATITNAVKDPETGKTLPEILKEREEDIYPKMTAGFAQEIVGDGSTTPEEFSFRPTAGEDRNVANTTYYEGERNGVARIEKIKGNSVVVNGEIVNGNYGGIKTTGFNQWDEQWELGSINLSTGVIVENNERIRSKNYNYVLPNMSYCFSMSELEQRLIFWYDSEYNFISYSYFSAYVTTKVSPSNAKYFKILLYATYGTTYKNDICINLAWDEYAFMNGMYQPYKPFERDLSWVAKYFSNGMRSAGSARDEIRFNSTTQKWEAVQNVGVRAYAEGDTEDTSVITDGTNTNYVLATPIVNEIDEIPNTDFDVSDYGTEELIAQEGKASAPLVADISYAPNALSTLKQVPDILKRLKALESAVASATATTNEEETVE